MKQPEKELKLPASDPFAPTILSAETLLSAMIDIDNQAKTSDLSGMLSKIENLVKEAEIKDPAFRKITECFSGNIPSSAFFALGILAGILLHAASTGVPGVSLEIINEKPRYGLDEAMRDLRKNILSVRKQIANEF